MNFPEITIKVSEHSEGGLNYDIFEGNDLENSVDGGLCTSGVHLDSCKDDDCEGCNMDKPYTVEDYKNAFEMAVEQALEHVSKKLAQ